MLRKEGQPQFELIETNVVKKNIKRAESDGDSLLLHFEVVEFAAGSVVNIRD